MQLLQLVLQVLSEEMERLLGPEFQQQNQLIGGIPADSDYIIFVIDTSGSMQGAKIEQAKRAQSVGIRRVFRFLEGYRHVALRREVIDFLGLHKLDRSQQAGAVGHITVMQTQSRVLRLRIGIQVINPLRIDR